MQLFSMWYENKYRKFQSMHPIKDATYANILLISFLDISIHAPYKGCNEVDHIKELEDYPISIHAPYKGCNLPLFLVYRLS